MHRSRKNVISYGKFWIVKAIARLWRFRQIEMKDDQEYKSIGCWECTKGAGLGFDFTMAFQPIVDTTSKKVFAQEALVRGTNEEPAG